MATLARLLLGYRYVLFVFFVICNAIICSAAVWNWSLNGLNGSDRQISSYLIAVGALGVVFIIPTVAIDIFRKNALPTRVWFETSWVGIFWALELAGASAVSAQLSHQTCPSNLMELCVSTQVLAAFTWIISLMLMTYLLALSLSAVLHQEDGDDVWQAGVRFYPWYSNREEIQSAPVSPTRQWPKPLHLATPRPPQPRTSTEKSAYPVERVQKQEKGYGYSRQEPALMQQHSAEPQSLYPAQLKSNLPRHETARTGATPPPLGDWPTSTRKSQRTQSQDASPTSGSAAQTHSTSQSTSTARPKHPRKGSNGSLSRQRPPPLDLSRISAYNHAMENR